MDLDKKYFDVLLSHIFDPIVFYRIERDSEGRVVGAFYYELNQAYERVMGVKREEVLGKSFEETWSKEEHSWKEALFDTAVTGKVFSHEGASPDTGKWLQAIGLPLEASLIVVIFIDRTEWKKADEAYRESEARLIEYRERLRSLATKLSLAEEQHRREIARTLHDRIGYLLATLRHQLGKLEVPLKNSENESDLSAAISSLEQLIAETRSFTIEISSPLLYEFGLSAALEALAERMLHPHGISWNFAECGERGQLDQSTSVLLYQMTQELLLNVIKHAKAHNVVIRLQWGRKRVRLLVEDDGRGASNPAQFWKEVPGIGLFSIRERLHSIGGEMDILTEKGKGTTVALLALCMNGEQD